MKNQSRYLKNIFLYILLQLAVTTAFFYDDHLKLDILLYGLSDYLLIVFSSATVSENIKSVSFFESFLEKSSLKKYVNLFLLCLFVVSVLYILLAVPILLATYTTIFPKVSFLLKQNSFTKIIIVSVCLIYISYVIFFYLQCRINVVPVLKRSFVSLVKMKECTLIMLCIFVISQLFTIFIENNIEQFSDGNNFESYSLSLAIFFINKRINKRGRRIKP